MVPLTSLPTSTSLSRATFRLDLTSTMRRVGNTTGRLLSTKKPASLLLRHLHCRCLVGQVPFDSRRSSNARPRRSVRHGEDDLVHSICPRCRMRPPLRQGHDRALHPTSFSRSHAKVCLALRAPALCPLPQLRPRILSPTSLTLSQGP